MLKPMPSAQRFPRVARSGSRANNWLESPPSESKLIPDEGLHPNPLTWLVFMEEALGVPSNP